MKFRLLRFYLIYLWPVCVNLARQQMWCEEAVMTVWSVVGEQFLCWASWNWLCAHAHFNLGCTKTQRYWDWHPQVPPYKLENWNSLLDPLETIKPSAEKQSSFLEWEGCLHHIRSFSWGFHGLVPLTLQFILQADVKWQEGVLCDT